MVLKSVVLCKICQHLVGQQSLTLRRNAIFVAVLTIKLALNRFHTAWAKSGRSVGSNFELQLPPSDRDRLQRMAYCLP